MTLSHAVVSIAPPDPCAMSAAQRHWDAIAKPLHSLGKLESAVVRIAGISGDPRVALDKRGLVIFCADNGVIAQGVAQSGSDVTALVTENFCKGQASVCCMARQARVDVYPVDIGVKRPLSCSGLVSLNVMHGTNDFTVMPAMSLSQGLRALETGIELAYSLKARGYQILLCGEMGIGNTTTSSALAAALLGQPVASVTGVGAGLSREGVAKKIDAIERGLALHRPTRDDPLRALCAVGGLDIAGMAGLLIGGAAARVPVLIDGFISAVSALVATLIAPACAPFMLASHVSAEPAGNLVLDALGLSPMITCDMHLGEGTGAVAALPLLDLGLAVYHSMPTFEDVSLAPYEDYGR